VRELQQLDFEHRRRGARAYVVDRRNLDDLDDLDHFERCVRLDGDRHREGVGRNLSHG
jgi:hypothetical protein